MAVFNPNGFSEKGTSSTRPDDEAFDNVGRASAPSSDIPKVSDFTLFPREAFAEEHNGDDLFPGKSSPGKFYISRCSKKC